MNDEGRRCGLPGCDVEIENAHGRPERRYCCAAHRAAARRERRAATHVRRSPTTGDLAETLPWLRAAAADPRDPAVHAPDRAAGPVLRPVVHRVTAAEPGVVARAAARRSRGGRTTRPRRRALAMLGVAGILAGGYAVMAQPHASVPALTTPDAETTDAWAQRADVALAAVNRQLDTLAQAEQQWQQLPASRSGVVPAPVTALEERRSVLQQRRATLQSQLDAYHSLHETEQDLADSEQHLQVVDEALADAPPEDRRSPVQEAAVAALDEQRDLRIRQRDTQRAELRNLEAGVSAAARNPLPDDSAATAEVSNDVLEMVRNGGRAPARPDPAPPRPDVVGGREHDDDPPSQETPTGGPPDPRGPRDDSEERRPAPQRQVVPSSVVPPSPVSPLPVSPQPVSPQPGLPSDPAGTLAQLRARARAAVREAQHAGAAHGLAPSGDPGRPGPATSPPTAAPNGTAAPHPSAPDPGAPSAGDERGNGPPVSGPSAPDPGTPVDPHISAPTPPGPPTGSTRRHPVPHPRADGAHHHVPPTPAPGSATRETSDPVPGAGALGTGAHGKGTGQDDDAIEEQNGHRSSRSPDRDAHDRNRSTGRHSSGTTASAAPRRHGAHRAADPDTSGPEKSGSEKSGSERSGSEKSGSKKSASEKSGSGASDRRGRSFDTHDDYIRLSRSLASTSSRD